MFTVNVEKRDPQKGMSGEDIKKEVEITHTRCHNGKAIWGGGWEIICLRCGGVAGLYASSDKEHQRLRLKLLLTSFDGKKRKIWNGLLGERVRVIQGRN